MQSNQSAVFARPDTLLGVCEALGQDFGINPFFLRVPLASLLIFYPVTVVGTYAAAAMVVILSRLVVPNPRPALQQAGPSAAVNVQPAAERKPLTEDRAMDLAVAA